MNYIEKFRTGLAKELPGLSDDLLEFYTLVGILLPGFCDEKDVHDAWALWKNKSDPVHKSLKPFHELTPEVQALDTKYVRAINKVAIALMSE